MKKFNIKLVLMILAAVLLFAGIGGVVYAVNHGQNEQTAAPEMVLTQDPADDTEPVKQNQETEESTSNSEMVYVLAGTDGEVKKIIVSDWIEDALNDQSYSVGASDLKVWDAQGNALPYPGDPEKELPVKLSMSYTLNGQPISAEELAGKSGHVTIRFDYENVQKRTVKIDGKETQMNVPFAMLTGMMLDTDKFHNVNVTNGKLMDDGKRITIIGFAFPGLQEDLALEREKLELPEYVEISADTTDFSMGVTVSVATDELFAGLDDKKLDSYSDLKDALGALTDAMGQLTDGSSKLYDGLATLLDKSGDLVNGLDQLAIGMAALKDGTIQLDAGVGELNLGAIQLNLGQTELCSNNDALNNGAKQIFNTLLAEADGQIGKAGLAAPSLTMDNYDQVLTELAASLDTETVRKQALQTVTEAVTANRPAVEEAVSAAVQEQVRMKVTQAVQAQVQEQVTAAVQQQVQKQVEDVVQAQVQEQVTTLIRANVYSQILPQVLSGMSLEEYEKAIESGSLDSETQTAIDQMVDAKMAAPEITMQVEQTAADQMKTPEVQMQIETIAAQQMADESVLSQLNDTVTAQMYSDEIQAKIDTAVNEQMAAKEIQDTIQEKTEEQIESLISEQMASDQVQSKLAAAADGAKTILSLKASLDGFQSFYQGLGTYTSGVSAAAKGTNKLANGTYALKGATAQLRSGAVTLYQGILEMRNGVPALVDGVSQLKDGALQLSDGLQEFDQKGVQKLVDAVDRDLDTLITRIKAMIDLSKNYHSFNDIADDSVKFLYRTDEITKQE